ncbi:MAG: VirB4 family type IV secretion/conjugal transfer ATPase [Acidiferrobacterales bacterium]
MRALKEFRTKAYGLPDLLPWAALVDNGVVLTKAGGLLAGWSYRGPDLDSATQAELAVMAARINAALCLGDGWVLNCDAVRAPAPGYAGPGAFPDRTTRMIDEVRRARYVDEATHYITRCVMTLTWFPPPDAASKTAALFLEGGKSGSAAQHLARFQERIREIEGRLGAFLELRRLVDRPDGAGGLESDLLGYLEECVCFRARPFCLGIVPGYLDAVLGRHDLVTGFTPRVGDQYLTCLAIEGFPAVSFPGILDFLARLPVAVRWSNRFLFLDPEPAQKQINRYRSRWSQKRKSLMNVMREQAGGQATHINMDMDNLTQDAVAALAEASSGAVRFGYYTSVVLLAHEDAGMLADTARAVRKVIEQQGFGVRIEDLNAVEAYLGSVPGNTWANVRRPLINTLNLAHLLPFTSVYPGPAVHPCPFYPPESPPLVWASTDGATPFRLCLHEGDVGHTAILGPTGAGKSTLLGLLMAQQFRYPKAQVFAFDKGYSALPLVWAAGGEHYDLAGADSELAFCPLGHIDVPSEQAWAAEWLESLTVLQGVAVTPRMRDELYQALVQLGAATTEPAQRTLTHYLQRLQSIALREALKAYALGGALGHLLDAERDGLGVDPFQVFEMEPLMQLGDKALLPVLTYLFHRLEQRFQGAPTLLVLDEAWVMLGHPAFRAKIREWLKVLRKANVAVVFATQSLSDLARSGIADVVFESCTTKLLLPNPEAMTDMSRPFYAQIGLNSRQIEIVTTAVPKRQYYLMQPGGRRLFELGLSAPELAFLGASGKEDIARIRVLRGSQGDAWPAAWLRERSAGVWAEVWEAY